MAVGVTVVRSGTGSGTYEVTGAGSAGNAVAVRTTIGGTYVSSVTGTYPAAEEGRWSGFGDLSATPQEPG